jgi:rhodanese-related sulfurtransferase
MDFIRSAQTKTTEIFPWDLVDRLAADPHLLLIDIREPYEFQAMHIRSSFNVPRGILETACEYDYEETLPILADARERVVVLICRSGNRSLLAAEVMQQMGYLQPVSLKTGLRGWSDYEQPLFDVAGNQVSQAAADDYFTVRLRPEQRR